MQRDAASQLIGTVTLLARSSEQHFASAGFAMQVPQAFCAGADAQSGACCFTALPPSLPPAGSPISAGNITFDDQTTSAVLAAISFDPTQGAYDESEWGDPDWNAGDTLRAVAVGETVPAFTLAAKGNAPLVGLPAGWDAVGTTTIPRSGDFVLSWVPDANTDTEELLLLAEDATTFAVHGVIQCRIDDSVGTLTVPAAFLAHFSPGDLCSSCSLERHTRANSIAPAIDVGLDVYRIAVPNATFE